MNFLKTHQNKILVFTTSLGNSLRYRIISRITRNALILTKKVRYFPCCLMSEVLDHWSNCCCLDCSHRASKFDTYSGFAGSKSDLSASGWDLPTIKINVNTTWWRWSYKATNFDLWLQVNMSTNTTHQVDFFENWLLDRIRCISVKY